MDYICDSCNKEVKATLIKKTEGLEITLKCDCGGTYLRQMRVDEPLDKHDDNTVARRLRYEQRCSKCENKIYISSTRMLGGSGIKFACPCGNTMHNVLFNTRWLSNGVIEYPRGTAEQRHKRDKRKKYLESCPENEIHLVNDKFPRHV